MNFPRVERSPSRCSDNSLILEVEESGAPMRNGRIRSGRRAGGGGSHGFSVGDTPNRPSNGFVSSDLGRTKFYSVPPLENPCSAKM